VKKMPIQDLKVWAHDLDMVIVMLEDPRKKQLASLVWSINKISNELTLTSIEKGFFVKNMKDNISHNVIIKLNEFVELLKIEQDELQKEFQRGSNHTFINFEGSSGLHPKNKKEENIS
jgi:hypothetical protein